MVEIEDIDKFDNDEEIEGNSSICDECYCQGCHTKLSGGHKCFLLSMFMLFGFSIATLILIFGKNTP